MSIFISIAAYRDPQLIQTIKDCLAKARDPGALRFGVCWQHGEDEQPLPFEGDSRFRIIDVPWQESRGACWARSAIMDLYDGEDYFLQLDSHHRFVPDWDVRALDQLTRTGSPRPILTAYATPFHPDDPHSFGHEPMQMNFDRFTPESIILFRPGAIDGWPAKTDPVRARFLSAHFLFTLGTFVHDVPYDPTLYFIGEEITLAVRAFTCGYDLFHPGEIIVWHEYTRDYRPHKHWTDHTHENRVAHAWHERDRTSLDRVKQFLLEPWIGQYGLGSTRTFEEYEVYAGVDFSRRKVQDYTRRSLEPPNPIAPPDWASRVAVYEPEITIDRARLPEGVDDFDFWYVGFHDDSGLEIVRADCEAAELEQMFGLPVDQPFRIRRQFESDREPVSWTVWPYSRSQGWMSKLEGPWAPLIPPVTVVTALLDLGRERLAPSFARSFSDYYLPLFERLLALDVPLVVYVHPDQEAHVWRHRRSHNTRVVPLTETDLEQTPWFGRVQEIRQDARWRAQADWLKESPQANLQHYNPLVFSKMRWVGDVARENPFGTPSVFWMDAGLVGTVSESLLHDRRLPDALSKAASTFAWICFPYDGPSEVHGFPRADLERYAGTPVSRVMRGGLFGGQVHAVPAVAALYEQWLNHTLSDRRMGTEESVFTLLAHRYPELFQCYQVGADGLIAPFVEAILSGRSTVHTEGNDDARTGYVVVDDLMLMQNRHALKAFDALWRHLSDRGERPARIVELGTGPGGLSVILKRYCDSIGACFVTYDRCANASAHERFGAARIDFRVKDYMDPFTTGDIARELQRPGLSILLCDGGDKGLEVSTFADYLKPGDLVLAHDYASSREAFDRDIAGKLWSWCEVTDADLADTTRRNGLEEVLPDVFHKAVWTCRKKRTPDVRPAPDLQCTNGSLAVYVQTFNAPDQLERWIDSVERAEPWLLANTRKVLLDNSSDTRTFAAYQDLATRHGFLHVRQGNLGISGGRLWCARHFEEQTDEDIMAFFEDDMLLHVTPGVCRNGLPTHVAGFIERAIEILQHEPSLDLLKLSFTEFFGDHRRNWAWYNVSHAERDTLFPQGNETRVDAIRSHAGLSYAIGEFHYSNWPMLITRRGNRTLFLDESFPVHEPQLMLRALSLARAGRLRSGVLLSSPINHDRTIHYDAAERREA